MHGDGVRVKGIGAERDNGARRRCTGTGMCRKGTGESAIAVHGDGARVHGKVQAGNGAASDNGARGRCTGVRGGAGRGPGQSAITVHGDGVYG